MTEEKQELATRERTELDGYGQIEDIKEMTSRIMKMVPNADKIGPDGCLALAQASIALDLNPFIGEVWAIPQGGGKFALSPGIKGLRKKAHQQGKYDTRIRKATPEELESVTMNPGDIARACDLYLMTPTAMEVLRLTGREIMFTGLAIIRTNDPTKMEHIQCVRKRAEADALRQAFDLSALGIYVEEPLEQWQIDNQAQDNALPFVARSRGRDDLMKETRPPHEVVAAEIANGDYRPEPAGAVVEGGVISSGKLHTSPNNMTRLSIDPAAEYEFYQDVLEAVPYFRHRKHVIATIKKLGMEYLPDFEGVILDALKEYASEHANAEAATEEQQVLVNVDGVTIQREV